MATPVIREENGGVKAGVSSAPGAGAADDRILSCMQHGNYFLRDTSSILLRARLDSSLSQWDFGRIVRLREAGEHEANVNRL
jgi:hypothetical protein